MISDCDAMCQLPFCPTVVLYSSLLDYDIPGGLCQNKHIPLQVSFVKYFSDNSEARKKILTTTNTEKITHFMRRVTKEPVLRRIRLHVKY